MFSSDKKIAVLENTVLNLAEVSEKGMESIHDQLEQISSSLTKVTENLINQSNKIEISARDILREVSTSYPNNDVFNTTTKLIRDHHAEAIKNVETDTKREFKALEEKFEKELRVVKEHGDSQIKAMRSNAKMVWTAIGIFFMVLAKGIDVLIQIYPTHQ